MSFVRRLDPRPFIRQWKDWVVAQLPDDNWNLLDIIYVYKPSSDINNWIPPFKGKFLTVLLLSVIKMKNFCIQFCG